jgi:hypothetical protein
MHVTLVAALVLLALFLIAAVVLGRLRGTEWENSGPGQMYSSDPTGNVAPTRHEFDAPRDDGDLP